MDVKPVNGATWRLEVSGRVADKRPWTLQDLRALPQTSMVIKHICVEGWSYIGGWSGPTLRAFLEHVGADLRAKYVAFRTADDYPSSIDMATALHPQTLLAIQYGGRHVGRSVWFSGTSAHGNQARVQKSPNGSRPLRLRTRIPADIGKRKAFLGLPAYDAYRINPHPAWVVLPGQRAMNLVRAQSTTPGGMPPPPGMSLAESTAMRFPQPVRVGDLLGREVLRPVEVRTFSVEFVNWFATMTARSWLWWISAVFWALAPDRLPFLSTPWCCLGRTWRSLPSRQISCGNSPHSHPLARRKLQTTRFSKWASPSRRTDAFLYHHGLVIELSLQKEPRPVTLFDPRRTRITRPPRNPLLR